MLHFECKPVSPTYQNRRTFRTVARESTGKTFEPGSTEVIFFGYVNSDVVAVGCFEPANLSVVESTPSTDVSSRYAHCVSYIFVKTRFHGRGFGGKLLTAMEHDMETRVSGRPFRLQASRKAVPFFETYGYKQVGEAFRPVCPGSSTFSVLFPMEKFATMT